MSENEHLGEALREQLHSLVADLEPSAHLIARVDGIATEGQARHGLGWFKRRRIAFALPLPVALATGAVLALSGGGASVASVTVSHGTIVITRPQIYNIAATNASLHRRHIYNMKIVPLTSTCRNRMAMTYTAGEASHATAIKLAPGRLVPGFTVIIGDELIDHGKWDVQAYGRFRNGHVPSCASSHGWGEGMGDLLAKNRQKYGGKAPG